MKKVFYLAGSTFPSRSANSIQVMKMCEALAESGLQVTLIARSDEKKYDVTQIFEFYGIRQVFTLKLFKAPRIWGLGGLILGLQAARYFFKFREKPDIIWGRNPYTMLAAVFTRTGKELYYEAHQAPANIFRAMLEKLLLAGCNCKKLIVISQALAEYYRQSCLRFLKSGGQIVVAPDGADVSPERLRAESSADRKIRVGYAGKLHPAKGIELIAKIAALLPHCEFAVAGGSNEEVAFWQDRCRQAGCDNINFYGHIRHDRVKEFLAGCDILLAPFQRNDAGLAHASNGIADWMSPLKIFEYMSAGHPIIASRLPVIAEILTGQVEAILVSPDSPVEWAETIEMLNRDKSFARQLAANARKKFRNNFTWAARVALVMGKNNL